MILRGCAVNHINKQGVVSLIEYDEQNANLKWRVNPTSAKFNAKDIPLLKYLGWLRKDLDPQHNGKNQLMYLEAEEAYEAYLKKCK